MKYEMKLGGTKNENDFNNKELILRVKDMFSELKAARNLIKKTYRMIL